MKSKALSLWLLTCTSNPCMYNSRKKKRKAKYTATQSVQLSYIIRLNEKEDEQDLENTDPKTQVFPSYSVHWEKDWSSRYKSEVASVIHSRRDMNEMTNRSLKHHSGQNPQRVAMTVLMCLAVDVRATKHSITPLLLLWALLCLSLPENIIQSLEILPLFLFSFKSGSSV